MCIPKYCKITYGNRVAPDKTPHTMFIGESGCCTANVKLANSADPCERRLKVVFHQSLSCLLTLKLFINQSTTGVNNGSNQCNRKCNDDNTCMCIPHRKLNSL